MKNKIIGILVMTLLIATALPAIGVMNETNNQLKEIPESFSAPTEFIFKPKSNNAYINLEYEYISRDKIIEVAEAYANYEWYPTSDNILHGDCPLCGERVDTVDRDYYSSWPDYWGWKAGQLNIGVPYKIGGFSSISGLNLTNPEDFYEQYTGTGNYTGAIHYAGDIYFNKPEPCSRACGIDCAGFVSRCWNLPEDHYTADLNDVSSPVKYDELKPGDLINHPNHHSILFKEFVDEDTIIAIDAGGVAWQVAEFTCDVRYISEDGFNIRLVGHYYDYTENFGNQLFEARQYNYISNVPTAPTIEGPSSGKPGTEYTYSFMAEDSEGDQVSYYIDWGDATTPVWSSFQASGATYSVSHTWSAQGTYTIQAKAKDTLGAESGWGTLSVTMPRNRAINRPFFNFLQHYPILYQLCQRLLKL